MAAEQLPEQVLLQSARHEAGHATMAISLGWEAGPCWISFTSREGECADTPPENLPARRRDEESALISLAGALASGWEASPGDGADREVARQILSRHCPDVRDLGRVWAGVEAKARAIIATEKFKTLHRNLTAGLLRREGYLGRREVEDIRLRGFDRSVGDWEQEARHAKTQPIQVVKANPVVSQARRGQGPWTMPTWPRSGSPRGPYFDDSPEPAGAVRLTYDRRGNLIEGPERLARRALPDYYAN